MNNKQRLFFYLCRKLGLDIETEKERLKQKFRLESFADIRMYQLDVILDQLKERYEQTKLL